MASSGCPAYKQLSQEVSQQRPSSPSCCRFFQPFFYRKRNITKKRIFWKEARNMTKNRPVSCCFLSGGGGSIDLQWSPLVTLVADRIYRVSIYSHPSQLNNSKRQRKLFGYCVEVLYNSLSLSQFLLGNFHSPNWCSLVRIAKSTRLIHQTSSTNQSPPKVFIFVILVVPWSWSLVWCSGMRLSFISWLSSLTNYLQQNYHHQK